MTIFAITRKRNKLMQPPPQMPQFHGNGAPGVPVIGQRQQQMEAQIQQQVQQMALSIYVQAAAAHVTTLDRPHQDTDRGMLKQLAVDSLTAARAFFEGLGVTAEDKPAEVKA